MIIIYFCLLTKGDIMKKKLFVILPLLMMVLSSCPRGESTSNSSSSSEGSSTPPTSITPTEDGSYENPYLIENADDLFALAEAVNNLEMDYVTSLDNAPYYSITNDIDLGGQEWTPIGNNVDANFEHIFSARILGNNHTISNFKITSAPMMQAYYGLFGHFHGVISDLNVTDFNIDLMPALWNQSIYVGGLVAYLDNGLLENINVSGTINVKYTGSQQVVIGGVAGFNAVTPLYYEDGSTQYLATEMRFITSDVDIENNTPTSYVGGVFGTSYTSSGRGVLTISYVVNNGEIVGAYAAGGITAYLDNYATISFAFNNGNVAGGTYAGGIASMAFDDTVIMSSVVTSSNIIVSGPAINNQEYSASIVSYYTVEDDPEYMINKTLLMNNRVNNSTRIMCGSNIIEDVNQTTKVASSELVKKDYLASINFANEWNYTSNAYPTLNYQEEFNQGSATVSFDSNLEGFSKESASYDKYSYDVVDIDASHSGYSFNGWFYDEELTQSYRFYLPLFYDLTLHGKWSNYATFAGLFVPTYYTAGTFDFQDDGSMYVYFSDYSYNSGYYDYYTDYLYFETDSNYVDGGWGYTYAEIGQDENLTFYANDASGTEFIYEPANDLIGYYQSGEYRLDFVTNTIAVLTLKGSAEGIEFTYAYENGDITISDGDEGYEKINAINVGVNGIDLTYSDIDHTITFTKVPFLRDYDEPFIGKKYETIELNDDEGVRDFLIYNDGLVRENYSYDTNSYSGKPEEKELTSFSEEEVYVTYTYTYESQGIYDVYEYRLTLNEDGETYTYSEEITEYNISDDAATYHQLIELGNNYIRQTLGDGTYLFTGSHNAYGGTSIYDVEIEVNVSTKQFLIYEYVSYDMGGGAYYHNNNDGTYSVYIKCASYRGSNMALTYYVDDDLFVGKGSTGNYYMFVNDAILGAFSIDEGVIYAYQNHTYLLKNDGTYSEVNIVNGSFITGSDITLSINGVNNTYHVTNRFAINSLEKI